MPGGALERNQAPLVRPNKVKKTQYQLASVRPGIKHQVEGFKPPTLLESSYLTPNFQGIDRARGRTRKDVLETGQLTASHDIGRQMANKKRKKEYKGKISAFQKKQEARARIKPIADPEAGQQMARKKAARRRMRGRLGTMLSQRESLGSRGTLG